MAGSSSGVIYLFFALIYERWVIMALPAARLAKTHTYGFECILMLFAVVFLGASAGLIAVAIRYVRACILILPALASVLVGWLAFSGWKGSVAHVGQEPSDTIVFLAPIAASVIEMILVVVGFPICLWRRRHLR